jgi:hypothetical protein
MEGAQLFLRYAFMPNRLGYCGSDDNSALFQYGVEGRVDPGLLELEQQFEGAYPYLKLIAHANGVPDPLNAQVVQAYWLGNDLLDRVDMASLYGSLEERFRGRTKARDWRWLAAKVPGGARPHHSFHVLELFPRVGMLTTSAADQVIATMGQCMIRWASVKAVRGDSLIVSAPRLIMRDGKLELTSPEPETVVRSYDGRGFVQSINEGDWVSVHWGWVCDTLSPAQRDRLERYTRHHVALCNQTI